MTPSFEYHAPRSLDEALELLDQYGNDARLLAGGTDLVPALRDGRAQPGHIVNIKRIGELRRLEASSDGLNIGALVSVAELMRSAEVRGVYPALAEAAASMAGVQIRNMATVGGNLCNASPAADMAPPLIALGAVAEIAGQEGCRSLPLADFFRGPGHTVLAKNEILVSLRVPRPADGTRCTYLKMAPRGAMDIAVVGVAVALLRTNGVCQNVHIVLGAVGPTPLRAGEAEATLRGRPPVDESIEQTARLAADEAKPIDDIRASAWYRRAITETLTRRALSRLVA